MLAVLVVRHPEAILDPVRGGRRIVDYVALVGHANSTFDGGVSAHTLLRMSHFVVDSTNLANSVIGCGGDVRHVLVDWLHHGHGLRSLRHQHHLLEPYV